MKPKTKIKFFAFPFGDCQAVRRYLDGQAARGWAFAGRYGLMTARFQETRRQELRYDVAPASLRRSPETMAREVQRRESEGWSPVDTLWGMDVYQSMPCRQPQPLWEPGEEERRRSFFLGWLLWSLAFLAVTAAALGLLAMLCQLSWEELSEQWYLSDSRTVLCLALPAGAVLAVLWLLWLAWCSYARCGERAGNLPGMMLRGALQALALVLVLVTLTALWLDQVPRLWMRLALAALLLGTVLLAPVLSGGDRRRQVMIYGGGVFACLLLALVLGWTVGDITYDTYSQGTSWRSASGLATLRGEELELGLDPEEQDFTAYYSQDQSLLVRHWEHYYEHWESGESLEVNVYTCTLPGLSRLVWQDIVPEAAETEGTQASLTTDGWYQVWILDGNRVIRLAGTVDWQQEGLLEQALEQLER